MGKLPFENEKREILVRLEEDTDPKFGTDPYKRPVKDIISYGVVNLDKPAGPTSHQVSAYVREIFGVKKAGHSGTLDPGVTGILPIGLGRATRITNSLLVAGKEYVCLMHLHAEVPEEDIMEVMKKFEGEISQLPPVRSAVKRKKRKRTIYYIETLEIQGRDVLFKAGTQAGTYIRKLCHDIGKTLGTGAHMKELRRTKAGPFDESTLCTLQDLTDAYHIWKEDGDEEPIRRLIQPVESGVQHLPKIWIRDTAVDTICNGASLKLPGVSKVNSGIRQNDMVAVMTLKDELVMVAIAAMDSMTLMNSKKGIVARPSQVFMPPGVYPKISKREK